MKKILLLPIGSIGAEIPDHIARALREAFQSETVLGKPLLLPQNTYNVRRQQYNSTKILQSLEGLKTDEFEYILGVIDKDLYVPELNFVFGQADMLARVAVIALPRLRQEFYGFEPDRELFLLRAAKEAIHELGHVNGLRHCPDPRCVMHFSNSLTDTDVKESRFCSRCRNTLNRTN